MTAAPDSRVLSAEAEPVVTVRTDARTGRAVLHVGRIVTEQDVQSLDDE